MLCIYRRPPYPYSEELLWIRMTLVPLLTGKSPGIMNGTRYGHTVSWILICFTFCTFFSPSVVRSWQVLRLLFVWEAYWRNSSSEDPVIWMVPFFLVALAIIVFIHYLMCNPLVRLSKYLLSKGMNTGGSASLSASYLPFLFLLILLFFHSCYLLSCFTFTFPRGSGQSVTDQSGMPRRQSSHTSYHWDPQFLLYVTFSGFPLARVERPILMDGGLVKWLTWPRAWGTNHQWVDRNYCDWLLVELKCKNVFYLANIPFIH